MENPSEVKLDVSQPLEEQESVKPDVKPGEEPNERRIVRKIMMGVFFVVFLIILAVVLYSVTPKEEIKSDVELEPERTTLRMRRKKIGKTTPPPQFAANRTKLMPKTFSTKPPSTTIVTSKITELTTTLPITTTTTTQKPVNLTTIETITIPLLNPIVASTVSSTGNVSEAVTIN